MLKYEFNLQGLSCAGCADTIERELSGISGLSNVTVDFIDKELILYVKEDGFSVDVLEFVQNLIRKIEPNIKVVLSSKKDNNVRFRDSLLNSLTAPDTLLAIIGIIVVLTGILQTNDIIKITCFIGGYLLIGWQIIFGALRRLFTRFLFNEYLLMTIATLGAIYIGEYLEAVAVMLFYQIGKFLETKMIDYSQKSISELISLNPEYVNLQKNDNTVVRANPAKVSIGDTILIKPGERVPLDCTVVEGSSEIDNSLITGESLPLFVEKGSRILSGAINLHSVFKAVVNEKFENSAISRIIEIVKNAKNKKTQTERFISRFARIYTPVIIILAFFIAAIPPLIFNNAVFSEWFYRALIFLVISCPCALVVSVPLSFFSGLAVLIKNGVLIKGGVHIENLAKTGTVIVDKTGTLTTGKMRVSDIIPAKDVDSETVLRYAYIAESHSNHPLARAVNMEYHQLAHKSGLSHYSLSLPKINSVKEIAGKGLIVNTSEGIITLGSPSFLHERGISFLYNGDNKYAVIAVALEDKFLGFIEFFDTLRKAVTEMISQLKKLRVNTIMLTGDKKDVAADIAKQAGIDSYYYGLQPEDKVNIVYNYNKEEECLSRESYPGKENHNNTNDGLKLKSKGKILFIGDGINDAPAMSAADVGIAMGGVGSAISIEAADIVLQNDEIDKLPQIIAISKKTLNKAKENIVLALGIKAMFLILGAFGLVTIWGAVFADVGVTILAVLNALQLLKYRKQLPSK